MTKPKTKPKVATRSTARKTAKPASRKRSALAKADWEPEELLLNKAARRSEQFVSISVADLFVGRRSAGRPGLDFASVGQASDWGSGRTCRTNRPTPSC